MFGTTTLQPYTEYEFRATDRLRITPGLKFAYYKQDFTQFADNGKTVGNLGGAASVNHAVEYHSWLPSFDTHYLLQPYWSVYGQFGKGQTIPPTSIFDVKGAQVLVNPKPTLTDTVQFGSVWKSRRATFDIDTDSHAITAVTAASAKSNLPAPGDILTMLAGRSVSFSMTVGFLPRLP